MGLPRRSTIGGSMMRRLSVRRSGPGQEVIRLGRVALFSDQTLICGARSVRLTPTEFRFTRYLARWPGQPVPIPDLLEHVWRYPQGTAGGEVVRAHVRNLRAKLREAGIPPDLIRTHRRAGYSFEPSAGDRRRTF
jgi:DNA-binding response OmpR family regulator